MGYVHEGLAIVTRSKNLALPVNKILEEENFFPGKKILTKNLVNIFLYKNLSIFIRIS